MAARKHTHKYHKVPLNQTRVWACALPDCSHYQPHHLAHMMPGKSTVCWGCGEDTMLGPQNMDMDQPYCPSCLGVSAPAEPEMSEKIRQFLAQSKEPLTKQ